MGDACADEFFLGDEFFLPAPTVKSEEVPQMPADAQVKDESVPAMPAGSYVKKEEEGPAMPADASVKKEQVPAMPLDAKVKVEASAPVPVTGMLDGSFLDGSFLDGRALMTVRVSHETNFEELVGPEDAGSESIAAVSEVSRGVEPRTKRQSGRHKPKAAEARNRMCWKVVRPELKRLYEENRPGTPEEWDPIIEKLHTYAKENASDDSWRAIELADFKRLCTHARAAREARKWARRN